MKSDADALADLASAAVCPDHVSGGDRHPANASRSANVHGVRGLGEFGQFVVVFDVNAESMEAVVQCLVGAELWAQPGMRVGDAVVLGVGAAQHCATAR